MKLRLTQGGFENYTGQLGVINFTNGLSEGDVLQIDALRIAASVGAEWEDGKAANIGQIYLDSMNNPAKTETTAEAEILDQKTDAQEDQPSKYTLKELEAIADEKGINGLRVIGEAVGAKGTSIVGLIKAIEKVQTKAE